MKLRLLGLGLVLLAAMSLFGQTTTTTTTITEPLTDTRTNLVTVASASGISASTANIERLVLVDRELMRVTAVNGSVLTVIRGWGGTTATEHADDANLIYGVPGSWDAGSGTARGVFISGVQTPIGPCTAAESEYVPLFHIPSGDQYDCISSVWRRAEPRTAGLVFEGVTNNAFETTFSITDPTADRTITVPNDSGAIITTSLTTNATDAANSVVGTSNGLVLEGATADAFETTVTLQDPTADRTASLPNATGILYLGNVVDVVFCGDLPNNTTHYLSPVTGYPAGNFYSAGLTANDLSYAIAGTGCAAEDNTTEGTADEVMYANNALKVLGMSCTVTGSGSNGVVINMRSATANLTPDVTITIPTSTTTGATSTGSTTDIAAGATVAVRVISTEDLSAQDIWCSAKMLIVP